MPLDGSTSITALFPPSSKPSGVEQDRIVLSMGHASPSWLVDVLDRLLAFAELQPGWDSYGAPSIATEAIDLATRFLQLLADALPRLPRPMVVPTTHGGVQLEWNAANRAVGLEFRAGAELAMFVDDGDQVLEVDSPTDLRPLLEALLKMVPR